MMARSLSTMRRMAFQLPSALRQAPACFHRPLSAPLLSHKLFSTTTAGKGHKLLLCQFISPYFNRHILTNRVLPAREKKYTQDHEWVDLPPSSKLATVGISTYAAHALGDVVFVELPTLDEPFSAGDTIAAVESVKSASDIKAPVAGTLVEVNELLEKSPAVMGTKPEDTGAEGGWLAKIELSEDGLKELEGLMGEKEYQEFITE